MDSVFGRARLDEEGVGAQQSAASDVRKKFVRAGKQVHDKCFWYGAELSGLGLPLEARNFMYSEFERAPFLFSSTLGRRHAHLISLDESSTYFLSSNRFSNLYRPCVAPEKKILHFVASLNF